MKTQAFFSNSSTSCRLQQTFPDGHNRHTIFDSTADLVNFCHENHITLTIADCHTED